MVGFGFQVREQRVDFLALGFFLEKIPLHKQAQIVLDLQHNENVQTRAFNPMMPIMKLETGNY